MDEGSVASGGDKLDERGGELGRELLNTQGAYQRLASVHVSVPGIVRSPRR